jgi:hypothetical protein
LPCGSSYDSASMGYGSARRWSTLGPCCTLPSGSCPVAAATGRGLDFAASPVVSESLGRRLAVFSGFPRRDLLPEGRALAAVRFQRSATLYPKISPRRPLALLPIGPLSEDLARVRPGQLAGLRIVPLSGTLTVTHWSPLTRPADAPLSAPLVVGDPAGCVGRPCVGQPVQYRLVRPSSFAAFNGLSWPSLCK